MKEGMGNTEREEQKRKVRERGGEGQAKPRELAKHL